MIRCKKNYQEVQYQKLGMRSGNKLKKKDKKKLNMQIN